MAVEVFGRVLGVWIEGDVAREVIQPGIHRTELLLLLLEAGLDRVERPAGVGRKLVGGLDVRGEERLDLLDGGVDLR